jgi:hypothetical protein
MEFHGSLPCQFAHPRIRCEGETRALDSKGGLAKVREIKIDGVVGGRIHIVAGTPANILPVGFVATAITDG